MRRVLAAASLAVAFALPTLQSCSADPEATDGGTPGSKPRGLDDLEVRPGEVNGLSCRVAFTTSKPSRVWIDLGLGERRTVRVRDPVVGVEHAVTAVGMRPDQSYTLDIYAQNLDGSGGGLHRTTCRTAPLPSWVVAPEVVVEGPNDPGLPWFSATPFRAEGPDVVGTAPVWIDQTGQVVWYGTPVGPSLVMSVGVDGSSFFVAAPQPYELEMDGSVRWTNEAFKPQGPLFGQQGQVAHGDIHHEVQPLENGNFACLRYDVRGDRYGDTLTELTRDGEVVWEWHALDYLDGPGDGDVLHGNALTIDNEQGTAMYSANAIHAIVLIDRATKEIIWRLGTGGDFSLTTGDDADWFAVQHAPVWLRSGNLLVFDNQDPYKQLSRVIEYEVDVDARTATPVWQYPEADQPHITWPGMGSAVELPSGNRLIAATSGTLAGHVASDLIEVRAAKGACAPNCDADDQIVRQFRYQAPYGVYRSSWGLPAGVELIDTVAPTR